MSSRPEDAEGLCPPDEVRFRTLAGTVSVCEATDATSDLAPSLRVPQAGRIVKAYVRNSTAEPQPVSVLSAIVAYLTTSPHLWANPRLSFPVVYPFVMNRLRAATSSLSMQRGRGVGDAVCVSIFARVARFYVRVQALALCQGLAPPAFDEHLHCAALTHSLESVLCGSADGGRLAGQRNSGGGSGSCGSSLGGDECDEHRREAVALLLLVNATAALRRAFHWGEEEEEEAERSSAAAGTGTADLEDGVDLGGCSALLRKHQHFLFSPSPSSSSPSPSPSLPPRLPTATVPATAVVGGEIGVLPLPPPPASARDSLDCVRCSSRGLSAAPELRSYPCGCTRVCRPCAMKMATGGKCKICKRFFVGFRPLVGPGDGQASDSDSGDSGADDREKLAPAPTPASSGPEAPSAAQDAAAAGGGGSSSNGDVGTTALAFLAAIGRQDPGEALRIVETVGVRVRRLLAVHGMRVDTARTAAEANVWQHVGLVMWTSLPDLRVWRLLHADRAAQPGEAVRAPVLARLLCVGLVGLALLPAASAVDSVFPGSSVVDSGQGCWDDTSSVALLGTTGLEVVGAEGGEEGGHVVLKTRGRPLTCRVDLPKRLSLWALDALQPVRDTGAACLRGCAAVAMSAVVSAS